MKILVFAPHVCLDKYKPKQITGFGRMVDAISRGISKTNDVFVTTNHFQKKEIVCGYTLLRHTAKDVFLSFSFFARIFPALLTFFKYPGSFKRRLNNCFHVFNTAFLKKKIKKIKPDIIHIHGAFHETFLLARECCKLGIPYVLTLHGIINIASHPEKQKYKDFEDKICMITNDNSNSSFSTVSTGTMKYIVEKYGVDSKKVFVIFNPVNVKLLKNDCDYETKYSFLDQYAKIYVCIGNVTPIRNQKLVVEAFEKYNDSMSALLIVGSDKSDIIKTNKKNVLLMGQVSHDEAMYLLSKASFNINASSIEGFGLSIIEGYCLGVPSIISNKIDSFVDCYREDISIEIKTLNVDGIIESFNVANKAKFSKSSMIDLVGDYNVDVISSKYSSLFLKTLGEIK